VGPELIGRLRAIDVAYTASRMAVIKRQSGIGCGIQILHHGPLAAFFAPDLPSDFFNRVVGIRVEALAWLDEVRALFRRADRRCTIIVYPGDLDAALAAELAGRGFCHSGFQSALHASVADAAATEGIDRGVRVQRVEDADALDVFLTAYLRGRSFAEALHADAKVNMRGWLGEPGWQLYLASLEGRPVAAAVLFVHGQDAYLADAATDPAHRGHGCQLALIARRIADAHAAGCRQIFGQTSFGGTSQRNMERGGLRLLCTPAVWTETGR